MHSQAQNVEKDQSQMPGLCMHSLHLNAFKIMKKKPTKTSLSGDMLIKQCPFVFSIACYQQTERHCLWNSIRTKFSFFIFKILHLQFNFLPQNKYIFLLSPALNKRHQFTYFFFAHNRPFCVVDGDASYKFGLFEL